MPTWDKATFDAQYSANGWPYGVRDATSVPQLHYQQFTQRGRLQGLVDMYVGGPGWASISDVAIIGGGFGWTAELLTGLGVNVVSVDTSPYVVTSAGVSEQQEIRDYLTAQGYDPDNLTGFMAPDQSRVLTTAEVWAEWLPNGLTAPRTTATVLNEDLSGNTSRRAVRQALGNNIDALITEHVLDGLDTQVEALDFISRVEATRPNPACTVVHVVLPDPADVMFFNLDLAGWQALLVASGNADHWLLDVKTQTFTRADGATI